MKAVKYVTLALVVAALACMVPMAESDADNRITIEDYDRDPFFDNMNGGSLHFYLSNSGSALDVTGIVTIKETGKVIGTATHTVPAANAENYDFVIGMGGYKSVGEHQIMVVFTDSEGNELASKDMIINVNENIMSNWTTFVVIIVVIIIIAIVIFMKMRDNQGKKVANTMTFEELEAQRKADMAAKSEKKAVKQPTSTERRKYKK